MNFYYKHKREKTFNKLFKNLDPTIKKIAKNKFENFKNDIFHNSLKTRMIQKTRNSKTPSYEITITSDYKAVFILQDNICYWVWIGSHNNFDKMFS